MTITYNLQSGRILAKQYRVLELLGNGWEGEVYKVEELNTGILRVVKLFYNRPAVDLPHIEYAKKLNRLRSCPIVIQYHHQGTMTIKKEKVVFLVSDFVEGEVLSQYVARQPQQRLLPFEALHLFFDLVLGVEHIHFLGEYHGDIHMENIIIKRRGLGFDVHFIDLLELGRTTKRRIQTDVYDLISILYELIGGQRFYHKSPQLIKNIIRGRKHHLIAKDFSMAGHLRIHLENLEWD